MPGTGYDITVRILSVNRDRLFDRAIRIRVGRQGMSMTVGRCPAVSRDRYDPLLIMT